MKKYKKNLLIGLAHVVPIDVNDHILKGSKGAYVNVLCYASNKVDLKNQAKKKLEEMGLRLMEIEDIEAVSERLKTHEIDNYLLELIPAINIADSIKLGTFHTYH